MSKSALCLLHLYRCNRFTSNGGAEIGHIPFLTSRFPHSDGPIWLISLKEQETYIIYLLRDSNQSQRPSHILAGGVTPLARAS